MQKDKAKLQTTKQESGTTAKSYQRPALKKHGKLKNTASQVVSTYTYTVIT